MTGGAQWERKDCTDTSGRWVVAVDRAQKEVLGCLSYVSILPGLAERLLPLPHNLSDTSVHCYGGTFS